MATLRTKLSDPYVKAIRWASDRIGEEGVVAFVTNNSFLRRQSAFDGMRKHLADDFDAIYILDLGGNARKSQALGTTHNVFGIQVGVSINLFCQEEQGKPDSRIFFCSTPTMSSGKRRKYHFSMNTRTYGNEWKRSSRTNEAHG